MVPEVDAAAFAMSPNQIGDIVTSSYGYHIIKVSEKIPAHKVKFADTVSEIKMVWLSKRSRRGFPITLRALEKKPGWKSWMNS